MFEFQNFASSLVGIGSLPDEKLYGRLNELYGEDHRYYHDHSHVAECLAQFQRYRGIAIHPHEIELAIWFHDAIYDVRRGDNEEKSAELAERELARLGTPSNSISRISEMILATKSHESEDRDTILLVDVDLGVLGSSAESFRRYDHAIRREYEWVPEEQYVAGRIAVLNSFLDRPQIDRTADIHGRYEIPARRNLAAKIADMEGRSPE